jgi:hypothetical protein
MPLAADPNATVDFSLGSDRDKPAASRPVFIVRMLTRRQASEIERLTKAANETKDDRECFDLCWQAITQGVVGWRNFVDPSTGKPLKEFSSDNLSAALSDLEIFELLLSYPLAVRLEERGRFNLGPAPPSGSASAPVPSTNATPSASTVCVAKDSTTTATSAPAAGRSASPKTRAKKSAGT